MTRPLASYFAGQGPHKRVPARQGGYNRPMRRTVFLLLCLPAWSHAVNCATHRPQYYQLLIKEQRYADAAKLILNYLKATPDELSRLRIEPVPSENGSSLSVSPADLEDGKSHACQVLAYSLTLQRDTKRHARQLVSYHEEWETANVGWAGCRVDPEEVKEPAVAAREALRCLLDPAVGTHQAARAIRGMLSQAQAGGSRLSDEDAEALMQQMRLLYDGRSALEEASTNSYYLPSFKEEDRASFCRAVPYVRTTLGVRDEAAEWQGYCKSAFRAPAGPPPSGGPDSSGS